MARMASSQSSFRPTTKTVCKILLQNPWNGLDSRGRLERAPIEDTAMGRKQGFAAYTPKYLPKGASAGQLSVMRRQKQRKKVPVADNRGLLQQRKHR